MTIDSDAIWPAIWLGLDNGNIAGVRCEACGWSVALSDIGNPLTIILYDLRNAWGLHVMEKHDGHGFRHFDDAMREAR